MSKYPINWFVFLLFSQIAFYIGLNSFILWKIKTRRVGAFIFKVDRAISLYRMTEVILSGCLMVDYFLKLVELRSLAPFFFFNPLSLVFVEPAMLILKLDDRVFYFYLLLGILFSLELINFKLLKKNRQELESTLNPKIETIPVYPIKVKYLEDNEESLHLDEIDLTCDLEWIDSENPEEQVMVTDALGREVILKIESLELLKFELK